MKKDVHKKISQGFKMLLLLDFFCKILFLTKQGHVKF